MDIYLSVKCAGVSHYVIVVMLNHHILLKVNGICIRRYDMTVITYTTTNKGCCVVDCVLDMCEDRLLIDIRYTYVLAF